MGVGDRDDLHPGGQAGGDSGFGILDDAAALRRHLEQFRRAEEDIGGRFAVRDVRVGDDGGEEAAQALELQDFLNHRAL